MIHHPVVLALAVAIAIVVIVWIGASVALLNDDPRSDDQPTE